MKPEEIEAWDNTVSAQEKRASRAEDSRRLAAGEVTPEQLQRENSGFTPDQLTHDWRFVPTTKHEDWKKTLQRILKGTFGN